MLTYITKKTSTTKGTWLKCGKSVHFNIFFVARHNPKVYYFQIAVFYSSYTATNSYWLQLYMPLTLDDETAYFLLSVRSSDFSKRMGARYVCTTGLQSIQQWTQQFQFKEFDLSLNITVICEIIMHIVLYISFIWLLVKWFHLATRAEFIRRLFCSTVERGHESKPIALPCSRIYCQYHWHRKLIITFSPIRCNGIIFRIAFLNKHTNEWINK